MQAGSLRYFYTNIAELNTYAPCPPPEWDKGEGKPLQIAQIN